MLLNTLCLSFPMSTRERWRREKLVCTRMGWDVCSCVREPRWARDCPEGKSGSASGLREAEPVAGPWVEAGAQGRGGLALPPFRAETRAGCFPLLSSPPYSSVPLCELPTSMSSCTEEITLHLSSEQKNMLGFFLFF